MVELSEVEKLIVKQAFLNAVADDVATRNPDNLRGRVDEMMKEAYYDSPMAAKSFDLKLLGEKVGTYSLTVSKGKPQQIIEDLNVDDYGRLMAWAAENGFIEVDMDAVRSHFKACGEVPDGCSVNQSVIPEVVGGVVTRTTVKVDERTVARVLGPQLEPIAYALIEGENDGQL